MVVLPQAVVSPTPCGVSCARTTQKALREALNNLVLVENHADHDVQRRLQAPRQCVDGLALREEQQPELGDDDDEHVMLGNGVVQLVDILHLQRLQAVGLEEQIALRKDGDELEV